MFLPLSEKIDNQKLIDGYDQIKKDYLSFRDNYFFDYSHAAELTLIPSSVDPNTVVLPKSTGYFWQVCPLIYAKKILPIVPLEVQECFTTKLIMSFDVKPVLAVFSILEPNSEIDPHIDTDDQIVLHNHNIPVCQRETSVVKYHFSLDIPDEGECALQVLNEKRILKNKDLNPFDETSTHFAYNRSSKKRGALIISYLRNEIYNY